MDRIRLDLVPLRPVLFLAWGRGQPVRDLYAGMVCENSLSGRSFSQRVSLDQIAFALLRLLSFCWAKPSWTVERSWWIGGPQFGDAVTYLICYNTKNCLVCYIKQQFTNKLTSTITSICVLGRSSARITDFRAWCKFIVISMFFLSRGLGVRLSGLLKGAMLYWQLIKAESVIVLDLWFPLIWNGSSRDLTSVRAEGKFINKLTKNGKTHLIRSKNGD